MTAAREPGWYPDPEHPTSRLSEWDGSAWTGRQRPTGYSVQPAGPQPVAEVPSGEAGELFGGTPAPTGGPGGPQRRWRAAVVLVAVTGVAVVVVLVVGAVVSLT